MLDSGDVVGAAEASTKAAWSQWSIQYIILNACTGRNQTAHFVYQPSRAWEYLKFVVRAWNLWKHNLS